MREEEHIGKSTSSTCFTCGIEKDMEDFGHKMKRSDSTSKIGGSMRRRSTKEIKIISDFDNVQLQDQQHYMGNNTGDNNQNITTLALCTCQQSRSYPFCDNTHKAYNKVTNSSASPILVTIVGDNNNNNNNNNVVENQNFRSSKDCVECRARLGMNYSDKGIDFGGNNTNIIDTNILQLEGDRGVNNSDQINNSNNTTSIYPSNTGHSPCIDHSSVIPAIAPLVSLSSLPLPENITTTITTTHPPTLLEHNKPQPTLPPSTNTTKTRKYIPSNIKDKSNQLNIITKDEVSEHNTKESLWMIIKGNVYDITNYVSDHPGGVRALLNFGGKDGTENVEFHSPKMLQILNSRYFIGRLEKQKETEGSSCIIS